MEKRETLDLKTLEQVIRIRNTETVVAISKPHVNLLLE